MPQSFCGHEILRRTLVVVHKLALNGLCTERPEAWAGTNTLEGSKSDVGGIVLSWCRRLFRDREIHVRALGQTILSAHLRRAHSLCKSIVKYGERESQEDRRQDLPESLESSTDDIFLIPSFILKAFSVACDKEEPVLVHEHAMRGMRCPSKQSS